MQSKIQPWLPPEATQPAKLSLALVPVFVAWSKHWFAADEANVGPAFQDDWPAAQASTNWRSNGDSAAVAVNSTGQAAIASAMLGCPIPHTTVQSKDREVIEGLAIRCVDDLLKRIAQLAGEADADIELNSEPIELDACSWWDVSLKSGKRAFKLALSSPAQVRIVKRDLPIAPKPELKAVARGLAEQRIELVGDLGRCSINFSDLEGLGVGDVVVLDRISAEPIELLIDGFASPFSGTLECVDGQTRVVLGKFKDLRNV